MSSRRLDLLELDEEAALADVRVQRVGRSLPGELRPRSGTSWRAAQCPRSAKVCRSAHRRSGRRPARRGRPQRAAGSGVDATTQVVVHEPAPRRSWSTNSRGGATMRKSGSENPIRSRPAERSSIASARLTCGWCSGASSRKRAKLTLYERESGSGVLADAHLDARDDRRHGVRELADLVVPLVGAGVQRQERPGRIGLPVERPVDRARHVADVDERPPGSAVAQERDLAEGDARPRRSRSARGRAGAGRSFRRRSRSGGS